jgi:hypothetical protein
VCTTVHIFVVILYRKYTGKGENVAPIRRRKPVRAHASGSRRRGLRSHARSLLPRGPARLEFPSPEHGGFIGVGAPACHGQLRCCAPRGLRSRAVIRDRAGVGIAIVALRLRQTATGCEVHGRNLDVELGQRQAWSLCMCEPGSGRF